MAKRSRKSGDGARKDLTGRSSKGRPSKADIRAAAIGIAVADKREKILAASRNIANLKTRRTSINEEIASIRADLQAIGIEKGAFDWSLRLLEMDPDDREAMLDSLGIALEAYGLGRQSDLFGGGEKPEGDAKPSNDAFDQNDAAEREGFKAGSEGQFRAANPHAPDAPEHEPWNQGWDRAQRMRAEEMTPKAGEQVR